MTDASSNTVFEVALPVTLPPNQFVTATATHPDGSTSEFSLAYAVGGVVDVACGVIGRVGALPARRYPSDP